MAKLKSLVKRLSEVAGACCRRLDPPTWDMRHLTRLAELTFTANGAGFAMWMLATSPSAPLPAGLQILRQDGDDLIDCFSGEVR